jgi:hypothetical protein
MMLSISATRTDAAERMVTTLTKMKNDRNHPLLTSCGLRGVLGSLADPCPCACPCPLPDDAAPLAARAGGAPASPAQGGREEIRRAGDQYGDTRRYLNGIRLSRGPRLVRQ